MRKIITLLFSLAFTIIACSDDESTGGGGEVNFNRSLLLQNLMDNHIIADFEDFALETEALKLAVTSFTAAPSEMELENLREALSKAYKVFQPVAAYDLGEANEKVYYLNLNAHPLDVSETERNITNPAFEARDLEISTNQDTQGLPALDYLINGLANTDADIVAFYIGANADDYITYIQAVANRIDVLTDGVLADFKGGFRNEFISNNNSSKTGAVNIFVDTYIAYIERRLRSSKIGIPAGELEAPSSLPNQIESLFNPELSRDLVVAAWDNAQTIYLGTSEDQISFSKILVSRGRTDLDNKIKTSFVNARESILSLNENLKEQATQAPEKMLETRAAMQKVVTSLKNDLVSELALQILTADGDGD